LRNAEGHAVGFEGEPAPAVPAPKLRKPQLATHAPLGGPQAQAQAQAQAILM
jgi:hypothetical protein